MTDPDRRIPEAVDQFLARYVHSVEYLEILVLLAGQPERMVTAEEIAQAIYSGADSVARRLERMVVDRLVEVRDEAGARRYCYRPASAELRAQASLTLEIYRERRVAVITAIASRPMDNVRAFSEAFRLWKKDKS
jgi:DNA-binding IclR family transcriptional regulator